MIKINKEDLKNAIAQIGYSILDDIVAPLAHIGCAIANLYIASINDHTMDESIDNECIKRIEEKYKVDLNAFNGHDPLATIVLYILIYGEYELK